MGPSLIPQAHGGALLSGGKPGNPGHNQHTLRERAQELRGQLIGQLEGAAKDLAAILETARESDGDRLRCKACGSFIPGVSKLKLSDILAVIRELRAVLPAQQEHEGLPPIQVNVVAGGPRFQAGVFRGVVWAAFLSSAAARRGAPRRASEIQGCRNPTPPQARERGLAWDPNRCFCRSLAGARALSHLSEIRRNIESGVPRRARHVLSHSKTWLECR